MTKNLKLDNIIIKVRMLSRHTAELQWEDRSAHCATLMVVDFHSGVRTKVTQTSAENLAEKEE